MQSHPPHTDLPQAAIPLASWGLIHVSGADARSFLHAQFSNDLQGLAADQAQWTAYCSAKGRMLGGFLACGDDASGFSLLSDRALVPSLTKRLRMFVLRAKVVIEDRSEHAGVVGILGVADAPAPYLAVSSGNSTRIALPPSGDVQRTIEITAGPVTPADESAWARHMILAGEVWLGTTTQDLFVPQMVNFDAIGGINFRKGCYPGQEVVARAHYRGAVKRRMYLATLAGSAVAGQPIFSAAPDAQECGTVANAVVLPDGTSLLLAVVPIDAQAGTSLHLGSADGPRLHFGALPYAIPQAA
jgi:folate-binding protein YgfZ